MSICGGSRIWIFWGGPDLGVKEMFLLNLSAENAFWVAKWSIFGISGQIK
jgi:hypothetical protein